MNAHAILFPRLSAPTFGFRSLPAAPRLRAPLCYCVSSPLLPSSSPPSRHPFHHLSLSVSLSPSLLVLFLSRSTPSTCLTISKREAKHTVGRLAAHCPPVGASGQSSKCTCYPVPRLASPFSAPPYIFPASVPFLCVVVSKYYEAYGRSTAV